MNEHRDEIIKRMRDQYPYTPARPRGTDNAKVIQVICTESIRGYVTNSDMVRVVTQYWDFEGKLLAERDPVKE